MPSVLAARSASWDPSDGGTGVEVVVLVAAVVVTLVEGVSVVPK